MKFITVTFIFAILIATALCNGELDPRCPQDESSESETTYLPHEKDCSKYYMCTNGRSFVLLCPEMADGNRLHWDAKEQICNWPEVANCKLK
uniref:CSON015612 protein n=1 Tax=Culicoides sonorensis TaxID=179676 RepID=A0A336LNW2_CULSO